MSVEFGKFDMSRLPIKWDEVDPVKMQSALDKIESSTHAQCVQLRDRVAGGDEKEDMEHVVNVHL